MRPIEDHDAIGRTHSESESAKLIQFVCSYRKPHAVPYSSKAMRTNWRRVRTPVFTKSCWSADFTEASEMFRCEPISLLLNPANTPFSTWLSRSVN
jgi:hypothetical protein